MKIGILTDAHLFHRNSQSQLYKKVIINLHNCVDMIIDCGDLLDKSVLNAIQSSELQNIFKDISIPFYIVRGNHESLGGVSLTTLLSINSNIHVCNSVEIHKDMLAHGATQEAVNNDDLAGVHIIIPEDTVLRAYHETTQAIYAQISKNICENQELVKLRDWLLPMLMNGQATIND